MLTFEKEARKRGFSHIAGVDEAGRGPLAGPVVASAVILPEKIEIPGLTDSKALTEKERNRLFPVIKEVSVSYAVHAVDAPTIDTINILQATRLAMLESVKKLGVTCDMILIDGNCAIDWQGEQKTIVKGDLLSLSIAAASVLAKVTRDKMMVEHSQKYPEYGFEKHKGYGSKAHKESIRKHGPSPIHRRTFKGVKEHCVLNLPFPK